MAVLINTSHVRLVFVLRETRIWANTKYSSLTFIWTLNLKKTSNVKICDSETMEIAAAFIFLVLRLPCKFIIQAKSYFSNNPSFVIKFPYLVIRTCFIYICATIELIMK